MKRAADVAWGVILIGTLWMWMLLSMKHAPMTAFEWWALAGKAVLACYMTAPIYREYLR